MKRKTLTLVLIVVTMAITIAATTINNFFMPGSQPGQSGNIETPDKCDNCHGGYDVNVEPAFNWRGGMMSQAARDPLYLACLAIAEQDAPGSGDLCIRCHAPDGWLNGRSIPTDGSALNNNDRQGVQCDFCHKLVKPTPLGTNPYPGDAYYTNNTYSRDQTYLALLSQIPGSSSNGMYIADSDNAKRGPRSDATGRHQMYYSPFHKSSDICGTCHDVSNPAFSRPNTSTGPYTFNGYNSPSPSFDLRLMFPVERTYSEWTKSAMNAPGTANHKTCQSCHMPRVSGKAAKMKDAVTRPDLALHDLTGGNTFIPDLVKILFPTEVNAAALDAGKIRAANQLTKAADLEITKSGNDYTVKVTNLTGHKLPSGYPEGRRIWINLKAYNGNTLVQEFGQYDPTTAMLTTTNTKVYEIKPGISTAWATVTGLTAGPSFHFAINDQIYSDNRIPPAGCTNAELEEIQSPVIGYTYADGQNWDVTTFTVSGTVTHVEATLYYQTVSKEYVEFLENENTTNTAGTTLYNLWNANGKSAPVVMDTARYGVPPAPPSIPLQVSSCAVTRVTKPANKFAGKVTLSVVYNNSLPVPGATVNVSYTGPTSGTGSGVTDASGQVSIETSDKKNPSGTWCFTVTGITKTGYLYTVPTPVDGCCEPSARLAITPPENTLSVFPNPAQDHAFVHFTLKEATSVRAEAYDNTGRKVSLLSETYEEAGEYTVRWNTAMLPKGIYFIRMVTDSGNPMVVKVLLR